MSFGYGVGFAVGRVAGTRKTVAPDEIAPTITSSASVSVAENTVLAHTLIADEPVTWSIVGGADQARFELSGATLRWASNGTKDYEAPNDADTNNTYIVTVRATDTAGNTTDQTITTTVTNSFEPADLGASLLGHWDADRVDSMTLSGSNITTWADLVGGYAPTQSLSAAKPTYSASGFNGLPGVNFDGTDDYLALGSVPFPTGATPCEFWMLVHPREEATTRYIFGYGGTSGNNSRRFEQLAAKTIRASCGTGGAAVTVITTNDTNAAPCVVRVQFTGTQLIIELNDGTPVIAAAVPNTGTVLTRMGTLTGSPAAFFSGLIRSLIVTSPLTGGQATSLKAYLKSHGGIT